MRKILFITGTRADYGKIKSLIRAVEEEPGFEAYIFVSGMHLLERFGSTYREILRDRYKNVYVAFGLCHSDSMSYNLGNVICELTGYVNSVAPDMIVVHGDRIDALAGAVVGALNNIKVAHIEGGELSGTIDESIRHAISKFSHIHLVCNNDAKVRLEQLGEEEKRIYIIGSPDIDIMQSESLPALHEVQERYEIAYKKYGILMFHPVTTEYDLLGEQIKTLVDAVILSEKNYIVVYPNNDMGSEVILNEYRRLRDKENFRIFPSIRFEYFLSLLKNADFMIGNSSAGIRETCVYGIPDIDIGSRQKGRYKLEQCKNIQHCEMDVLQIIKAIEQINSFRIKSSSFGQGNSTEKFMEHIRRPEIWEFNIQKKFVDLSL